MGIINLNIDDKKKKKIEKILNEQGYRNIDEFLLNTIDEKINFQDVLSTVKNSTPPLDKNKIMIPSSIPDGKFLGIAEDKIVAIGDNVQEVTDIVIKTNPNSFQGIIHKGKKTKKSESVFILTAQENTFSLGR